VSNAPSAPPPPRPIPGILTLAWPLVISFALRAAFTWVDRIYAAYLPEPDLAQAAIGLAQPLEFLLIACWVGSSNAVTSRLAAALGAGEGERLDQVRRAALTLIWALLVLFLLLAAGIWFAAPHLGLEPALAEGFRLYAVALIGGSALTAFWSILPDSEVKAHQDTRTTMWSGILSSLLNVLLNTVFVFVFHWGLFGIGLSTALGRLGGLFYAQWRARAHQRRWQAAARELRPGRYPRPIRALLAIAIPSSLTYVLMSVEGLLINGVVANSYRHLGLGAAELRALQTDALAAWSVYGAAISLLAMPAIATGVAVLPLASRLSGAGDPERLRRELATARRAFLWFALLGVLPLAWFGWPALTRALLESDRALSLAGEARLFLPLVVAALGPFLLGRPLFDAFARSRLGLAQSALRSLLLIVPLTYAGGQLAVELGAEQMLGLCAGNLLGVILGTASVATVAQGLIAPAVRPAVRN
jgi:Na+-driven multidrug efflux pump